jgi:hypothetical protein
MTKAKASLKQNKQPPARTHKLDSSNPKLTYIGGSKFDAWNGTLANQVLASGWYGNNPDADRTHKLQLASLSFLAGVEPKDELEGMLAAQLLASHNAAMECYRRAMISEQTFEGRKENLNQANKLSRTHATLLEALNRHRGKGQQKVTVEHVHVHEGGHAIVGNVEGGGIRTKSEDQPHALGYAAGETLRSENPERETTASHRRWQTVGAGCTAARHPERQKEIGMHSSTGALRWKQLRYGRRFQH